MDKFNMLKMELEIIIAGIDEGIESPGHARAQMDTLKASWNELRAISFDLQSQGNSNEIQAIHKGLLRKFVTANAKLNDAIASNESKIGLPVIKLPQFSGKPTDWRTFIELFNNMVHFNESINNSTKMQYLKTSLSGEAASLVSHLASTAEHYQICYELLERRYNNKRELVRKLVGSIFNIPKIQKADGIELRHLFDIVNTSILGIKNLGVKIDHCDPLLVYIISSKFDDETIKHYECQLTNIKEIESLADFLSYIEMRCAALQSAESRSHPESEPE